MLQKSSLFFIDLAMPRGFSVRLSLGSRHHVRVTPQDDLEALELRELLGCGMGHMKDNGEKCAILQQQ